MDCFRVAATVIEIHGLKLGDIGYHLAQEKGKEGQLWKFYPVIFRELL